MGLTGKVVVITGSTKGIGLAVARACCAQGATVVVGSRSAEKTATVATELADLGSVVTGFAADVSQFEHVVALRDHALEHHGRIDVWFNNAGVSNGYRPMDEETPSELHDLIGINLLGHMYSAQALIPHFREHGGYLMNMCGRGWKGEATPYTSAYAASKAAIASLTRSLAAENSDAPNVSINAFVPGMVDTDFYVDIKTSPRLESTLGNVRLALDAFGTPVEAVGRRAAALVSETPGRVTGRIYPMLTPGRMARGGAKMAWWGITGKLKRG